MVDAILYTTRYKKILTTFYFYIPNIQEQNLEF